jgi:hypothetical protein
MRSWFRGTDSAKLIGALEADMGVPVGFFARLESADDWSFVVQLHALIESALTYLIVGALGDPRLEDFVSSLPLANQRMGKLGLASALELISREDREFVVIVSSLRNKLVHRAQGVAFDFKSHFSAMEKTASEAIYHRWGFARAEGAERESFLSMFMAAPKLFFHLRAFFFFWMIYVKSERARAGRRAAPPLQDLVDAIVRKGTKAAARRTRAKH